MKNRTKKESKILKWFGITIAIIILISFMDWSIEKFIEGWNNPL